MFDNKEFIDFMTKNIPGVSIGFVSGFVHYIYEISKGESFSFTKMVINIIIAGWIGYLCQEMNLSSVYISIAGFCAYPLLNLIEKKGPKFFSEFLFEKTK